MSPTSLILCALCAVQETEAPSAQQPSERGPLGMFRATIGDLREPASLAFSADGKLVVVEAHGDRVSIFDADGKRVASFGDAREGHGQLLDPRGVAVAADVLYVADSGNHRVVVFGLDGAYRSEFGAYGTEPDKLRDPRGLAVAGELVAIADTGNNRVQLFRASGEHVQEVTGGDGFVRPSDVAFDDLGNLYVADTGNHRVVKLDPTREVIATWGDFGPHPGFFAEPSGLDCVAGVLYVVDSDNHRVQYFSAAGERLGEWGLHALRPREGEGHLHYPTDVAISRDVALAAVAEPFEDRVQLFVRAQPGESPPINKIFERVTSAHFGPMLDVAGELMVATEPSAPAVMLYDLEHEVKPWEPINITRYANWGRGFGQLRMPVDAAIDAERKLVYVADADNATLLQFSFTRDETTPLGFDPFLLKLVRSVDLGKLALRGQTPTIVPAALRVDLNGCIYVVDTLQRTVFHFSPELALRVALGPEAVRCQRPVAIDFSASKGLLHVVDELGGCVQLLSVAGELVATIGSGTLVRPGGIAVARDESIFVSDAATHCIHHFDTWGKPIGRFGAHGLGPLEFHKPRGLSIDRFDRLFVLDWGNHRLQVLDQQQAFVSAFGSRLFVQPTRKPR